MIERVVGILREKSAMGGIVDVGGVGFRVLTPVGTLERVGREGDRVELYTHFTIRQENVELYAFSTSEERELFRRLISIHSIGPKTALAILSTFDPEALRVAVYSGDIASFQKIPGVGKKTAERLFVELKNLLPSLPSPLKRGGEKRGTSENQIIPGEVIEEAIQALRVLGLATSQARAVVEKVGRKMKGEVKVEDLIKAALREGS